MKKTVLITSALLGVAAGTPALAAPIVVSTLSSWDGSSSIGDFGASGFSGWGQFLVAPTGSNRLLDFTFLLSDALKGSNTNPVPVTFTAHLVQYNPFTRYVVGPLLYSSAPVTVPLTAGMDFDTYTFDIDAEVTAGSTYMMFLFANNFELQIPDDSRLRLATSGSDLAGGAYNIPMSAIADLDAALASPWLFTAGTDLAFSATFDNRPTAPVPEPDTLLLLGTAGAAGLFMGRRVRLDGLSCGRGGPAPRRPAGSCPPAPPGRRRRRWRCSPRPSRCRTWQWPPACRHRPRC